MPAASPRVAVVVRTKDRPRLLARALRSITSQSMPDWECVVVDDGGDAAEVNEVISGLPEEHREKVTAVHHESSRGRWVSANAGVLATSAPLVVLHDDDDTWHPEFLDRACAYLEAEENAERGGVVSRIDIVWEEDRDGDFVETGREPFQPHLAEPTLSATLLFNRFVPIGFVYRRSAHAEVGLYDERLPVIGDWNFNLKMLARGPLAYLDDEALAFWHQRPDQDGPGSNSVIESHYAHEATDAFLRDEALRAHVAEQGIGLALYLTKFIDQRFVDVENGVRSHLGEVEERLLQRIAESEEGIRHRVDEVEGGLRQRVGDIEGGIRGDIRRFSLPERVLRVVIRTLRLDRLRARIRSSRAGDS